MMTTTSKAQQIAEDSGLPLGEVEAKLADGFLYYRDPDYFGGEQPPGEWLDAKGTEYVVAGHGRYGRGADLDTAKRNFRKYGGRLMDGYVVLTFGPGSVMTGIGAMGWYYLGEAPAVREVEPRGTKR